MPGLTRRHARRERRAAHRAQATRRRGFTLIELCIAISLLMIGMVSVIQATSRMHSLRRQNRERTLAQNALRSMEERIHARSYALSSDPSTWARGLLDVFAPGGSFGDTFEVAGLTELDGQVVVGTIRIVTSELATDQDLGVSIGMPRDLNADGLADAADVSNDARILPVVLSVRWRSQSGETTYRNPFYVMGY
jgi:Tfp pilus assembly protein PilV